MSDPVNNTMPDTGFMIWSVKNNRNSSVLKIAPVNDVWRSLPQRIRHIYIVNLHLNHILCIILFYLSNAFQFSNVSFTFYNVIGYT